MKIPSVNCLICKNCLEMKIKEKHGMITCECVCVRKNFFSCEIFFSFRHVEKSQKKNPFMFLFGCLFAEKTMKKNVEEYFTFNCLINHLFEFL